LLRSGVERQLAVVGEALGLLRKCAPKVAARIPSLDEAVATQHVIVHGYGSVDDAILWLVVTRHLGTLLKNMQRQLQP
jgi:uncharacterized protein with HEPN domain